MDINNFKNGLGSLIIAFGHTDTLTVKKNSNGSITKDYNYGISFNKAISGVVTPNNDDSNFVGIRTLGISSITVEVYNNSSGNTHTQMYYYIVIGY